MALSDLPTIYDLTPDYASNLAAEMFWPGDQGRWQAANLAGLSQTPTETVLDILGPIAGTAWGYNRHGVLGAVVWGVMGFFAPIPVAGLVAYEGFAHRNSAGLSGYTPRRRRRSYRR